jgi:hypothetical protein
LIKEELFKDLFVGEFLAGFARILLFVEAVIRTSLASQPILTMFDLEMSVLCHPFFAKKKRFEDASMGKLQNHPLVKEAFGLSQLKEVPEDFPPISSSELVSKLFSPPIIAKMLGKGERLSNKRSRSVRTSLMKLAAEYGFTHWSQLGLVADSNVFLIAIKTIVE